MAVAAGAAAVSDGVRVASTRDSSVDLACSPASASFGGGSALELSKHRVHHSADAAAAAVAEAEVGVAGRRNSAAMGMQAVPPTLVAMLATPGLPRARITDVRNMSCLALRTKQMLLSTNVDRTCAYMQSCTHAERSGMGKRGGRGVGALTNTRNPTERNTAKEKSDDGARTDAHTFSLSSAPPPRSLR